MLRHADGLSKEWLNHELDPRMIDNLAKLHQKNGLNVAFEGGEAESLVLDCPLFRKKIVLEETEIEEESKNTARLIIKKARLEEKE